MRANLEGAEERFLGDRKCGGRTTDVWRHKPFLASTPRLPPCRGKSYWKMETNTRTPKENLSTYSGSLSSTDHKFFIDLQKNKAFLNSCSVLTFLLEQKNQRNVGKLGRSHIVKKKRISKKDMQKEYLSPIRKNFRR